MKSRHKLAAAVCAVALGLAGVAAIGASAGSSGENTDSVTVGFAVVHGQHGFVARAVIAEAPAPPPATRPPYQRVFQAHGKTRALAIENLVGKMSDELSPRQVVVLLGYAIAEEDLG